MYNIAIATSTRAEYGMLTPLIKKINDDKDLNLSLLVTGTHLSHKYGYTVNEIKEDGYPIAAQIPILEEGNTPYDVSVTMANALRSFAEYFRDNRPDLLVILGDRTEMLGVASAALNERIPIAHISGGEVTAGAVDEAVRHSLTKMAYIHFPGTEEARKRVIQLGESPDRVYNVGILTTENIMSERLYSESEIREALGLRNKYVVVTFHPVTLEDSTAGQQVMELCAAMDEMNEYDYCITMANADTGSDEINDVFRKYSDSHDNVILTASLGARKYLSAVKYAGFILGNSSSGMGEAPVIGTPSVNIGDRQKGRLVPETVVNCSVDKDSIVQAMKKASTMPHVPTKIFGGCGASDKMLAVIKDYLMNGKIDLKDKLFYDIK